jgi:hypothetical protein
VIKVMRRAGKRAGPFDLKDFVEAGGLMANDLKLPDGPLVKAAYEHAEEISDPWLFKSRLAFLAVRCSPGPGAAT